MFGYFRKKRERQDLVAKIAAYQKAQDELELCREKMRNAGINSSARAYQIVSAELVGIIGAKEHLEDRLAAL